VQHGRTGSTAGRAARHGGYVFGVRTDSTPRPDVFVLGAGVCGLTSAIYLAEAGLAVTVQSAEAPLATTSVVAGALWGTHLVGSDERVPGWAAQTRAMLTGLGAAAGARVAAGVMAVKVAQDTPPEAAEGSDPSEFTACPPEQLPPGYAAGWRVAAPLVSMPVFLGYLRDRLTAAGGRLLEPRSFATLAEAAGQTAAPVLVNCPGAGARTLVPDPSVVPVRGQVVVAANPGLDEFFVGNGADPDDLTYLFPHGDTVVLGGTQEHGNSSRVPDPATAERIIAACIAVEPRLAGAAILGHRAGLRPARPLVRLETEPLPGNRAIVHNYGHGGAGVSLSWGCAADVTKRVLAALG
jgi:D-amino-acid oxidase